MRVASREELIQEIIEDRSWYYHFDPDDPFTIPEVTRLWVANRKPHGWSGLVVYYPTDEVWKYVPVKGSLRNRMWASIVSFFALMFAVGIVLLAWLGIDASVEETYGAVFVWLLYTAFGVFVVFLQWALSPIIVRIFYKIDWTNSFGPEYDQFIQHITHTHGVRWPKLGVIHDQTLCTLPTVRDALLRKETPEDLVVVTVHVGAGEQQVSATRPQELKKLALQWRFVIALRRVGQDQGSHSSGLACFRIPGIVVIAVRRIPAGDPIGDPRTAVEPRGARQPARC